MPEEDAREFILWGFCFFFVGLGASVPNLSIGGAILMAFPLLVWLAGVAGRVFMWAFNSWRWPVNEWRRTDDSLAQRIVGVICMAYFAALVLFLLVGLPITGVFLMVAP